MDDITKNEEINIQLFCLNLFEKLYFKERQFKEESFKRLNFVIAAIPVFGYVYYTIYLSPPPSWNFWLRLVTHISSIYSFAFLCLIAIKVFKVINFKGQQVPASPKKLKEHLEYILSNDSSTESSKKNEKAIDKFIQFLTKQYTECANDWYFENIEFSKDMKDIFLFLYFLIISTFISFLCFALNNFFYNN